MTFQDFKRCVNMRSVKTALENVRETVYNAIAQISAQESKKSCHLSLRAYGALTPCATREQVVRRAVTPFPNSHLYSGLSAHGKKSVLYCNLHLKWKPPFNQHFCTFKERYLRQIVISFSEPTLLEKQFITFQIRRKSLSVRARLTAQRRCALGIFWIPNHNYRWKPKSLCNFRINGGIHPHIVRQGV